MSELGFKIKIHESWLRGVAEPVPVPISDLDGEPVFLVMPTDEEERLAIARRAGYCEECEGRRAIAVGYDRKGEKLWAKCPRCQGKGKRMLDPEVMRAVMTHIVRGWSGWRSAEGSEIPFTPENLAKIATHRAIYAVVVSAAQKLKVEYEEVLDENLEDGADTSSREAPDQTSDRHGSQEPFGHGD